MKSTTIAMLAAGSGVEEVADIISLIDLPGASDYGSYY